MFEEMKKFLKGKDPLFYQELNNIEEGQNEFSPTKEEKEENEKQLKIIAKYRQTDAYKRLLKRQGQAVRRIERIKENFEKKRLQVGMLAVNTKGNIGNQGYKQMDLADDQQRYQDLEDVLYEEKIIEENCETDREGGKDSSRLKQEESQLNRQDSKDRKSLRQVLSSQTPLSYQVIMEERSSIASVQVTNNDKSEMRSNLEKIKGYDKVQPYMKTQVNYFRRSNPNKKQGKRLKSMNNNNNLLAHDNFSLNYSQIYDSNHQISNDSPKPTTVPNQKFPQNQDVQYVTGIEVYQTEILKNKSLLKSEHKAFYQPSILINHPTGNQSFYSNIRSSKSRGTAGIMALNDQNSTGSKFYPSSVKTNKRPQTTANGKQKIDQIQEKEDIKQIQNKTHYSEAFKPSQKSQRSQSGAISNPKNKITDSLPYQRNNQLPKMLTQSKERLKLSMNENSSQQQIQDSTVKELDEEQQDSRFQSKKQTINSGGENQPNQIPSIHNISNSRSYAQENKIIMNVKSFNNPRQNASFNLSRGDKNRFSEKKYVSASRFEGDSNNSGDIFQKYGLFNNNQSQLQNHKELSQSFQHNGFKNSVQSYNFKKNMIVQNLKSKEYWPESIKHPNQYREFYWAPDLSFCGFATNNRINRSNKNLEIKNQTSFIQKKQRAYNQLLRIKKGDNQEQLQDKLSDLNSQDNNSRF